MNTFGNALKITLFGKSHESHIGIVVDGIPPGLPIDRNNIKKYLDLRRPRPIINTARVEDDDFIIIGGFKDRTDGAPITILIKNGNFNSADYDEIANNPRPGHADFPAFIKYRGMNDFRGGGQFSGRMTAPIVAVGGMLEPILKLRGIKSLARVLSIGDIVDDGDYSPSELEDRYNNDLRVISPIAYDKMISRIMEVRKNGDSIGGIVETVITGAPIGLGEPFFNSIESEISHLAFSIPGIKAIEFGDGFMGTRMKGSEFNDELYFDEEGNVKVKTNHSGGINGGLTNGNPIIFRVAVRPTSSIPKVQNTVNLVEKKATRIWVKGRHDPCIVPRVVPIMESVSNIVVMDMLLSHFGGEYFEGN